MFKNTLKKSALWVSCVVLTGFCGNAMADCGEAMLGGAVGGLVGGLVGGAIAAPRPCRTETREVVVREVRVPDEMPARRRKLESLENKYKSELDDLYGKKDAIERRIRNLESELSDVEASIETHEDALKRIESKKRQRSKEYCE